MTRVIMSIFPGKNNDEGGDVMFLEKHCKKDGRRLAYLNFYGR